jgi:hypothetical protein
MSWGYFWAAGGDAAQPLYDQFQYGSCQVGCGPVAWAMLFGWGDNQAESGTNAYWAPRTGLYLKDGGRGANDRAPLVMTDGVRNVICELHGEVGTWCVGGNGPTPPGQMDGAVQYLNGRTGTRLDAHWNAFGYHEDRLRDYAGLSIRDRKTPAIIGTGWLTHYPLAYGYAWQNRIVQYCFLGFCWTDVVYDRWFKVNQGWGGGGNDWIEGGTWFAGEIYP